jgi:hypothetical protein
VLAHGGSRLNTAISGSGVREAAASLPTAAVRDALISAYKIGFSSTFDRLMAIASIIALVGAVGSLALVRQRDFVPSYSPGEAGGQVTEVTAEVATEAATGIVATEPAPPPRRPRHAHSKSRRRSRQSAGRAPARGVGTQPRPGSASQADAG